MRKKLLMIGTSVLLTTGIAAAAFADTVVDGPKGSAVHINTVGEGMLRNAEVTAVTGTTVTARVWLMDWTVQTDTNTRFRRRFSGVSELSEIAIGDRIDVNGTVSDKTAHTMRASMIHDRSIRKGAIRGTVSSITAPDTFVVKTESKGDITVTATANTVFKMDGVVKAFADLMTGMEVRVRGTLKPIAHTMTATDVLMEPENENESDHHEGDANENENANTNVNAGVNLNVNL